MSTGLPLRLWTRATSMGATDYLPFNKTIGGIPFSRTITLSDFASSAIAANLLVAPDNALLVNSFQLQRVTFNNANFQIPANARQVVQVGTMTAPRTVVLPPAASVRASDKIKVKDQSGTVTTINTISVIRDGTTSDTVNGGTTALISQGYGDIEFESDGVSSWTYKPSTTSSPTVITSLNVESMYNPLNPIYGAAGNGADDYNAVNSCFQDALVGNGEVYLPILFQIRLGITLPSTIAGFKLPTISSVDTSTSTVTFALAHGKLPGDVIMFQGMAPAGLETGIVYFGSFSAPTTTALYTDQRLAILGGTTGRIALTGGVTTTGTISSGGRNLTVAAELGAQIGTTLTISGVSGANGGFSVVGGVGTGTLVLNTTASASVTSALVTYNCWIDWRFYDGGFKVVAAPGGGLKKHPTFNSSASAALLNLAIGSNIDLLNCTFEGLSNMYVPWGTTGTIPVGGTVLTVNDATWARAGMAILIGDYDFSASPPPRIKSISGNNITLMAAVPSGAGTPDYSSTPAIIRGTITSGVIGLTGTGTGGSSSVTMSSVNGLFGSPGQASLSVKFDGISGSYTITSVNSSTKVITVSPVLAGNITNALLYLASDAGDDGVRISSVHKARIQGCIFRHFGDAAFRAQTNVADYSAATASNPYGGVNTGEIVFTHNYLFNIYQTSTTTNDYIHGGAANVIFENNTFDMLVGSVKFANRVPGGRNVVIKNNTILSSYNHGLEIDSYNDLKTFKNQFYNIYNQGIVVIANNAPAGTLGQGVVGFPFGGLDIDGDIFDNVGIGNGVSCVRIGPDSYKDGSLFDFPGLRIRNCTFRNISNTTAIPVNIINGSLFNFHFENNDYQNCQAVNLLKMTLRSSTTAGFVNGLTVKNNKFNMNNASATAVDIRGTIGITSVQPQINEIDIESNFFGGTCTRGILLENVANARIKNNRQNLIGGTFFLPNNTFGFGKLTNIAFENNDFETTGTFGYSLAGINGLRIIDNRHKITPLTAALTNGSNTIVVGSTSGLSQGMSGALSGLNGSGVNYQQNYTILSVVDSTHLTIYPTPTDTVANAKMSVNGPLAGFSTASISNSCTNVTYLNNEENGGTPNFNQIPVKTKSRASILREEEGTVFPTAGTWLAGSRFNLITSNGATAWIFETSGTFGSPTGSPTATTNGTDNTVTFSSLAAIPEGGFINVAGAWTGARQILNIDPIAKTGVVVGSTPAAVTSAAVTYVAPTFASLGIIAPVTFSDQDLTLTSTQRQAEQIGTLTASRTVTLPPANSVGKGTTCQVYDMSGTVTGTNTIVVSRAGSDGLVTSSGIVATVTMTTPGSLSFTSNGVNKWVVS